MQDLIIIGAGGHAKEVLAVAIALDRKNIFLAEDDAKTDTSLNGLPIIRISDLNKYKTSAEIVVAVGSPLARRDLVKRLQGFKFTSLIHPSAIIGPSVEIGPGSIVAPGSILTTNISVRNHVLINTATIISHDCVLEDFSTVSPNSTLGGNVHLGKGSFISLGATIRNGVTIGDGSLIGAGSVVINDIKPSKMVAGIPAVEKKTLEDWPTNI